MNRFRFTLDNEVIATYPGLPDRDFNLGDKVLIEFVVSTISKNVTTSGGPCTSLTIEVVPVDVL
jgi:hypothetical protein